MKTTVAALSLLLLAGCGGGPVPAELATPRVVMATRPVTKDLFYRDARLNPVHHIVPIEGSRLLMVGNQLACTIQRSGRAASCASLSVDLWELDVLSDASGTPTTIVGSGGWGKPSVAVLQLNGALRWRFDGGYDLMATAVAVETPDHALVVAGNRAFDLETGAPVDAPLLANGAVGSADFDRDGRLDILQAGSGFLRVVSGSGPELAGTTVGSHLWDTPLRVRFPEPFVVLSTNEEIESDRQAVTTTVCRTAAGLYAQSRPPRERRVECRSAAGCRCRTREPARWCPERHRPASLDRRVPQ